MNANCISIFVENHTNNAYSKSLGKMKTVFTNKKNHRLVIFHNDLKQIPRVEFLPYSSSVYTVSLLIIAEYNKQSQP